MLALNVNAETLVIVCGINRNYPGLPFNVYIFPMLCYSEMTK